MSTQRTNFNKACLICGEKLNCIQYNYGAQSCYNCGKFFSQSVLAKKRYWLMCEKFAKANKMCLINEQSRSRCKKCRYWKCLQVGMQPETVRNQGKIKVRLWKYSISTCQELLESLAAIAVHFTKLELMDNLVSIKCICTY